MTPSETRARIRPTVELSGSSLEARLWIASKAM
jgi:hypothetical protein